MSQLIRDLGDFTMSNFYDSRLDQMLMGLADAVYRRSKRGVFPKLANVELEILCGWAIIGKRLYDWWSLVTGKMPKYFKLYEEYSEWF